MEKSIVLPESGKEILEYLYEWGYARTHDIKKNVVCKSIQTTRNRLKTLSQENFIGNIEIVGKSPKDEQRGRGQFVYYLKSEGIKALGKPNSAITKYQRNLRRFPTKDLLHYLETVQVLRLFVKCVENDDTYTVKDFNEFHHAKALMTHISSHNGKKITIRPDARLVISKCRKERLVIHIEYDRSTESQNFLFESKISKYCLQSRKYQIFNTFPALVLFVMNKQRICNLQKKMNELSEAQKAYFLFLPSEAMESDHDLFRLPLLVNGRNQNLSLKSLTEKRDSIIQCKELLSQAIAREEPLYQMLMETKYCKQYGIFFPIEIDTGEQRVFLAPDATLRIRHRQEEGFVEDLFALIWSIPKEIEAKMIEHILWISSHFLMSERYLSKVTKAPFVGCLILIEANSLLPHVQKILQKFFIEKVTRIALKNQFLIDTALHAAIWLTETGKYVSIFPAQQKN